LSAPATATVQVTCGGGIPAAVDGAQPAFSASQSLASIAQIAAGGGAPTSAPLTVVSSTLKANVVKFYTGTTVKLAANVVDANFTCGFTPATLRYKWTFASIPTGSQPSFDSSTSPTPSFVPDVPGDYFIQLDLVDSAGKANTQVFTTSGSAAGVRVGTCGVQAPTSVVGSLQPSSPAPSSQVGALTNAAVILDGSSSYSPDNFPLDLSTGNGCGLNKPLTYTWQMVSQPAGGAAALNDPTRSTPAFTPNVAGPYVNTLVVSDGVRSSNKSSITVVADVNTIGTTDFAPTTDTTLSQGTHHYHNVYIPAGVTVTLPAPQSGLLEIVASGDVYIGGRIDLSGSPGADGPNGDVSWRARAAATPATRTPTPAALRPAWPC
jgi:hypothetical protein